MYLYRSIIQARTAGLMGPHTEANEPGDAGSGKEQRKKAKTKKEKPINK